MPIQFSVPKRAFLVLALTALSAARVAATTYVLPSDEVLADQASVIAEVKVVSVESSPAGGMPSTDYLVDIDRLIKGYTSGSSILVRLPGGGRPDGMGLKIWGAPSFREGSRALLFLQERPDGTYGVVHLGIGAFHEVRLDGRKVLARDLAGAEELKIDARGRLQRAESKDAPRDAARFVGWLEDRMGGVVRPADYRVKASAKGLQSLTEQFTLIRDAPTGLNVRWFQFDTGGSVTFRAHTSGQTGVPGGGFNEIQAALQAWNNDPNTPVRYLYGGTSSASGGFTNFDNTNVVLFGDPNQDISGTFSCNTGGGGVLAIGGPWYANTTTGRFRGTTFAQAQGADIVTNDGIECFLNTSSNPSKSAEALFGHELGHTLGLGHSSENRVEGNATLRDALMYAFLVNSTRGAALMSDDRAGLRQLYDPALSSGPCRAGTNTLCLQKSRFKVEVSWQNQFNGTSGVGRAIPRTDATGLFSFGDPSNVELMVKILNFGDVFKVFYGQLTNLRFTITVTDTKTGAVKAYQNTTGECGGIDNAGFLPAFAPLTEAGSGGLRSQPLAATACRADRDTLCLLNNRFAVEIDWRNQRNGQSGKAGATALSKITGTFFFSDAGNVEVMAKLVDLGDRLGFFYGSLSDFEYTIRVTDTSTGTVKTYTNPAGKVCGGIDDRAF